MWTYYAPIPVRRTESRISYNFETAPISFNALAVSINRAAMQGGGGSEGAFPSGTSFLGGKLFSIFNGGKGERYLFDSMRAKGQDRQYVT